MTCKYDCAINTMPYESYVEVKVTHHIVNKLKSST